MAAVPSGRDHDGDRPLALRSVERTLASRYSTYVDEVQRLIQAGLIVMERDQTTNPRVSEIVAEAGLSNQAFYRHFHSKDELMLAIMDDGQRQLVGYLAHQMAKETSGLAQVGRWVDGIMSQAVDKRAAQATRSVALNSDRLRELFPDEFRRLEQLIEAPLRAALMLAAEQGEIPRGDEHRDAQAIFRLSVRTMEAFVIDGERPSRDDLTHVRAFIMAAIGGCTDRPTTLRSTRRGGRGSSES
jgi:AcrR family transcriptional regulator